MKVFWNLADWANAIAALPVESPLPTRTALVPRESVAHALRRELLRAGRAGALAGTRFLTPRAAAAAVLQEAGVAFTPREEALRPPRLLALVRHGIRLAHFPADLLRSKPGWDEAFARTITDLEGSALRPGDLEGPDAPARIRDVATVWRALDEAAGRSWTTARIYFEAAGLLERRPECWPFPGATLAIADGLTPAAEARFLRAIPGARLGLLASRPLRLTYLERIQALFGRAAREALESSPAPRAAGTERDLLASYLFEPPSTLADPARPRSTGPDGTVLIEEHAGVEEEIEATADWVASQVTAGTPLEEIAVLVSAVDPLAGLVAQRLARLPWHEGSLPVHVAGGLPLGGTAGGARALAVIRALRAHLSADALAEVLPALRTTGDDGRHLSFGAAMDLAWSLGTVGGNPARPEGALEWAERAARREQDLESQLARAREASDDPERSGLARRARDLERLLADLRAVRPALDALVALARLVVQGAPLSDVWQALRGFLAEWLLQPGAGPRVHAILDERLGGLAADPACGSLAGDDAMGVLEGAARTTRLREGRFGEPAVFVGTPRAALGLGFQAARVIGLAEGHLPPVAHEDPVLPDAFRERLAVPGAEGGTTRPPTAADASLESLHALDTAVRNARAHVALSAPRLDLDRSQREPSSVMLEAAAALGRPNASTGEPGPVIPDAVALRRDAFVPAGRAALGFRRRTPLGEPAWHDGVALGAVGLPSRWRGALALDLERIAAIQDDGLLGPETAEVSVPGLTAEWPISASGLGTLLGCPYAFLLGNVLGFDEPASAPARREIGQPSYGSLFHLVAEEFYRTHGAPFGAREGALEAWRGRADEILDRQFEAFLEQYPLVGVAVRERERERLKRDVQALLEYEWQQGTRRQIVAVERFFGSPAPVPLRAGRRSLFVRGQIDRIDVEQRRTVVRDLKTGRAHPRHGSEREPDPGLDTQIALYALVARQLAGEWGVPKEVGAAYTYVRYGADERTWVEDFREALEPAAQAWLATAAELLAARAFPRTPHAEDCTFCPFRPVCGGEVYARAEQVLTGGGRALAWFRDLKGLEAGD